MPGRGGLSPGPKPNWCIAGDDGAGVDGFDDVDVVGVVEDGNLFVGG